MFERLKASIAEALDFQSRVWVVSDNTGGKTGDTFVVDEDNFKEPLQWMKRKGYSEAWLNRVERMKLSQVLEVEFAQTKHSLVRVK